MCFSILEEEKLSFARLGFCWIRLKLFQNFGMMHQLSYVVILIVLQRDKVSGQAFAEIPPQTRDFKSHSGIKSNPYSVPTPAVVDNLNSNSEHNVSSEKQLNSQSFSESDVRTTATLEDIVPTTTKFD